MLSTTFLRRLVSVPLALLLLCHVPHAVRHLYPVVVLVQFERAAVASDEYRTTTAWVFVIELAFVMAFVIACITSASLFFWRSRRHNTNR